MSVGATSVSAFELATLVCNYLETGGFLKSASVFKRYAETLLLSLPTASHRTNHKPTGILNLNNKEKLRLGVSTFAGKPRIYSMPTRNHLDALSL